MSRASVRAGLASYLDAHTTAAVVYSTPPKSIPENVYFAGGAESGWVLLVTVGSTTENRVAIGGVSSGKKRIDYTVELQVIFRHVRPPAADDDELVNAMEAFDVVIDELKAAIRADRTAGGAVWQWGEQLTDLFGDARALTSGVAEQWGVITTTATEWITS